jgi:hypothetical protein
MWNLENQFRFFGQTNRKAFCWRAGWNMKLKEANACL